MAQYEDIEIDQGSDVTLELRVENADGSKKNLTDHTIVAWMKENYADDSADAIKFNASVVVPPEEGVISLKLTNLQTDLLDARRKYMFDVEMTHIDSDSNTIIERILEGTASVAPSVTK